MARTYTYAQEKMHSARRVLMAPHPFGEATSYFNAFQLISLLDGGHLDGLPEPADGWVEDIRELMSTEGLSDPDRRGLFMVRAEVMTEDERSEFSRLVDELASFLDRMDR